MEWRTTRTRVDESEGALILNLCPRGMKWKLWTKTKTKTKSKCLCLPKRDLCGVKEATLEVVQIFAVECGGVCVCVGGDFVGNVQVWQIEIVVVVAVVVKDAVRDF